MLRRELMVLAILNTVYLWFKKKPDQVISSIISRLTPIISFFLLASSFRSSTLDFKVTNSDFWSSTSSLRRNLKKSHYFTKKSQWSSIISILQTGFTGICNHKIEPLRQLKKNQIIKLIPMHKLFFSPLAC